MTFLGQDDKSQHRSKVSYLHLKMSRVTFCLASSVTVNVKKREGKREKGHCGVGRAPVCVPHGPAAAEACFVSPQMQIDVSIDQ